MPRALGVDFRADPEAGGLAQRAIGVFLESLDGSDLEWKYAANIEDEADIGDPGFWTYLRTVDALGNLPEWWRKAGVMRESELGLFDSLIEANMLWTPREWLVRRDVMSYPGFRFFTVFMVGDQMTLDRAYKRYVTDGQAPRSGDRATDADLLLLPDPELVGWRPVSEGVLEFTINMLMTGVVGYRWPRSDEDGGVDGPVEVHASARLVDSIDDPPVPTREEIRRSINEGIEVEGVRIGT